MNFGEYEIMYFSKGNTIKKSSYYCLIAAFCFSMSIFSFARQVYAQAAQGGDVACTMTSPNPDVLFPDIGLFPNTGTSQSGIYIDCTTTYFYQQHAGQDWLAYGAICLGIKSSNPNEAADPRYLYLNGDPSSSDKLQFNYYSKIASTQFKIGDGESTPGYPFKSLSSTGSFQKPTTPWNLNLMSNGSRFMINAQYYFNQSAPVGVYSNNFTFLLHSYAGSQTPSGNYCSAYPTLAATLAINVQAVVKPACKFSVTKNINFGVYSSINSSITASGELSVQCNLNTSYQIGLDAGNSKDISDRRMNLLTSANTYDSTNQIGYNLYFAGTNTIWGNTKDVDTYKGVATSKEEVVKIDAKLNTTVNPRPIVGTYQDVIIVTLTY